VSGSVSEGIIAGLIDQGFTGTIQRVISADSLIPLGGEANHVLLSQTDVEEAAWATG
jgi:2-oxoisovalerate dehydrogenase E1 component